jgi:hypothetical protein
MNKASPGSVSDLFSLIRKIDARPLFPVREFSIILAPGAEIEIPLSNQLVVHFFNSGKSLFFLKTDESYSNECSVIIKQDGIFYCSNNERLLVNWAELSNNKLPVGDLLIWKRP